jgi:hypothetical protein
VGLPDGWMLDPSLAALDPIFWLHHANVDRLWEVWLQRAGPANTTALSRQRVDVNVPRPALARRGAATATTSAPTKIFLSLEGMTADKPAGSYDIYIGVAGQQSPAREQFVARLAPFGIAAASSPKGPHGGAGLSETFDISQAIARLRASGLDVTAGYDVTIVPVKGANDAAVQIGRIAIYEG